MILEESTIKSLIFFSVLCEKMKKHENTVLGYKKWSKFVVNMILKSSDVDYIKALSFIFSKNPFGRIYSRKCDFLYRFMRKLENT